MSEFEKSLQLQMAKIETELAKMKAMQTKFTDTLAQILTEQKLICTQVEAAALTNSVMMVKLTQLSQQLTRVEADETSPTSDGKTAEKLKTDAPSPFSGFSFGLSKSEGKFKEMFGEGLVSAQSMSHVKPQAPKAEAPSTTTESTPLPSFSELFKSAPGPWSCGGCYVNNKSDAATCIACGTPNPSKATQPSGGASSSAAAVSSPFKFGIQAAVKEKKKEEKFLSLGEFFKSDPNSWNCTICYFNNCPSLDKCSLCQTVRSGNAPTGPFRFGLSTPSVFGFNDRDSSGRSQVFTAPTFSTFTFGTTPATSVAAQPPSVFGFGAGDSSGKSQVFKAPTSSTFTFGSTPATSGVAQPATGFAFGLTVNTPSALATTSKKVTFTEQSTTDDQKPSIPELSPGFNFKFPQQHVFSFQKRQSDVEDDQVVESQDRDFTPTVALLPPEIKVVTGEEGQEVLYSRKAKLFHFVNKEWKESPVTATNEAAVKPKKISGIDSPQPTEKVTPTSVDQSFVTSVKLEQQTETARKAASVIGAPPAFGTVPVEQTRNENLKPLEASPTTADSGFVFGAVGSPMSFSALAASSASTGFAKREGENPWSNSSQPTSFFSAFSKTGAGSNTTTQNDDTAQSEHTGEVKAYRGIYFEPVIPMPELITVKTGEEQDEVLYSRRAKLYVYDAQTREWKERAIGNAKILRCPDGRARIVVRRDTVHKVACNHYITDSMELKPLTTATNCVAWSAVDFAENDPKPQLFALKVGTEDRLNDFKRIFAEEVERARKAKEGADACVMV